MNKLFCIISTCLCLISCSDDVAFTLQQKIDFWNEKLQWSRELIYASAASGNTILDTKGTLLVTTEQFDGRSMFLSSSESICNCSISNDWCTPNNVDCEEVDCETTDGGTLSGCGLLLLYDCNGRCGGI